MEERNENFLTIERIKKVEIEKLARIIQELEERLEAEVVELLNAKGEGQRLEADLGRVKG